MHYPDIHPRFLSAQQTGNRISHPKKFWQAFRRLSPLFLYHRHNHHHRAITWFIRPCITDPDRCIDDSFLRCGWCHGFVNSFCRFNPRACFFAGQQHWYRYPGFIFRFSFSTFNPCDKILYCAFFCFHRVFMRRHAVTIYQVRIFCKS